MADDFRKATMGDVVKLEKAGDHIDGKYVGIEESRKFKDSFALRIENAKGIQTLFVTKILKELLDVNGVMKGQTIRVLYKGKKANEAKTREYNDYELYVK